MLSQFFRKLFYLSIILFIMLMIPKWINLGNLGLNFSHLNSDVTKLSLCSLLVDPISNITLALFNASNTKQLLLPGQEIPILKRTCHELLPRALNEAQEKNTFHLLEKFVNILKTNNISFAMTYGTLLGSYFFHNILPWDDDLDISINIKDINKLRAVFRSRKFKQDFSVKSLFDVYDMYGGEILLEDIPMNNTHYCGKNSDKEKKCYQIGKVYDKSGKRAGGQVWTFPFLDFCFFVNNGTHVISHVNTAKESQIITKVDEFLPFVTRPFWRLWLPAPRNTSNVLQTKYEKFLCKMGDWDHVNEIPRSVQYQTNCQNVKTTYPYIKRRPFYDDSGKVIKGKVIEDLEFNGTVLHSVLLNSDYKTADILEFD